jgi:hypothetical protein
VVSQVEDAMEGEVEFGIEGESATSSIQMSDSVMAATVTSRMYVWRARCCGETG